MELTSISIAQLRETYEIGGPNDEFIISSDKEIKSLELFRHPCRLDAVVLAICTGGRVRASINLKEYEVTAGMMIINLPENIIQIHETSEDFRGHVIVVSLAFLKEVRIDIRNTIPFYMQVKNHPSVRLTDREMNNLQKFFTLFAECMEDLQSLYRIEIAQGLITALLYKCSDRLDLITVDKDSVKSRRELFFTQFMELLTQYHKEQRSVGFYAEKMHITPKYMSSMMKEMSGRSAAEWIDEYVILEAKTLLKYSGMSIQEIAYHLNFSTQSFFGKYFKQHTGMSPSQYKLQ
ncbi:MAG: AraC family transcriptional regulator [Rikenellaceae bacterium]|nr:AraC family transcriptional regulator [Rikenellaceae bacterium]